MQILFPSKKKDKWNQALLTTVLNLSQGLISSHYPSGTTNLKPPNSIPKRSEFETAEPPSKLIRKLLRNNWLPSRVSIVAWDDVVMSLHQIYNPKSRHPMGSSAFRFYNWHLIRSQAVPASIIGEIEKLIINNWLLASTTYLMPLSSYKINPNQTRYSRTTT